jgi:hypothetical protein
MQHPDETLANISLENEMKHLEHILETYMYDHCNMCNILIYFCNIQRKTSETLETYSCNMGFASTNGGTPVRRSTAAHGPHCAVVARTTRRRPRHHTNLVPLACLLEHPSWRRPRRGGSTVEAGEADWAQWEMWRG